MSAQQSFPVNYPAAARPPASGPWSLGPAASKPGWDHSSPIAGSVLNYHQDQEIYGDGDDAQLYFKVLTGVVRTCKFLDDGRRQIEAFHAAGDLFGFEAGPEYTMSAEAVCDCTVVSYRRRGFDTQAAADERVLPQMFAAMMRNLARAQVHTLLLGRRTALEKVASFLVDWADRAPGGKIGGKIAALPMTRQDVADYLGLTIETVSRMLSQLERQDLIELSSARHIKLKDPMALRELNA